MSEGRNISELLARKELEWKELQHRQIFVLQNTISEAEKSLQEQRAAFLNLKKDFIFNMKVLQERDKEIEALKATAMTIQASEEAKTAKISDLQVKIESLKNEILTVRKNYSELHTEYTFTLKEHKNQIDQIHSCNSKNIDACMDDQERAVYKLQRKIHALERDLELQKKELSMEFDCQIKKRESEYRSYLDNLNSTVLANELQVKLLSKELEIVRAAELNNAESLQKLESEKQKLESEKQKLESEKQKLESEKQKLESEKQKLESEIKKLESDKQKLESEKKKLELDKKKLESEKKKLELDKKKLESEKKKLESEKQRVESDNQKSQDTLREKEYEMKAMLVVKEAQIQELNDKVQRLQHQLERQEEVLQQMFQTDEDTLKTSRETCNAQVCEDAMNQDLQMNSLQKERENLEAKIAKCKKNIDRLKTDEDTLKTRWETCNAQVCEDPMNQDLQNNSLQKENLEDALTKCKEDIKRYQERLAGLLDQKGILERARVQQHLSCQKPCEEKEETLYLKYKIWIDGIRKAKNQLEAELKEKDRRLNELQVVVSALISEKKRDEATFRNQGTMTDHGGQLEAELKEKDRRLNELQVVVSALISERKRDDATFRNQGTMTDHGGQVLAGISDSESNEIQQLQEQNSELRQVISLMRNEMVMLSKQMSPSAPEHAEAPSDNTQRTAPFVRGYEADKVTSSATSKSVEIRSASMNSMVSEIQQKSEDVKHLRDGALALWHYLSTLTASKEKPAKPYIAVKKLQNAMKTNTQLIVQKQQLTDLKNKLQAELASPLEKTSGHPKTPPSELQAPGPQGRLSALESLQYQLTSQELQFAQYKNNPNPSASHCLNHGATPQWNSDDSAMKGNGTKSKEQKHPVTSSRAHSLLSPPSLTDDDSSLRDIWEILDHGSSISLLSSQEKTEQAPPERSKNTFISQSAITNKMANPASAKQAKSRGGSVRSKIRNYNIKE